MVHSLEKLSKYHLEKLVVETIKRIDVKSYQHLTLQQYLLTIVSTGVIKPVPSAAEWLRHVSEDLDEEYFILEEAGEKEPVWKAKFQAARVAYALSEVSQGVSLESIGEFIYEMAHAFDSSDTFLDNLEKEIELLIS